MVLKYDDEESVISAVKFCFSHEPIDHSDIEVEAVRDLHHPSAWACRVTREKRMRTEQFHVLVDVALLDPDHPEYIEHPDTGSCPYSAMSEVEFTTWPPTRS